MRERGDVGALLWGALFILVALATLWTALGHHLAEGTLQTLAPVVLIALGVLVALVFRRRR